MRVLVRLISQNIPKIFHLNKPKDQMKNVRLIRS